MTKVSSVAERSMQAIADSRDSWSLEAAGFRDDWPEDDFLQCPLFSLRRFRWLFVGSCFWFAVVIAIVVVVVWGRPPAPAVAAELEMEDAELAAELARLLLPEQGAPKTILRRKAKHLCVDAF